jgi:acyl carrier protein
MLADDFHRLVLAELKAKMPDKAAAIEALKPDDDLLGSGVVDSYGLIDLCLALEARTGATIDIAELEPEQFGSVTALFEVVRTSGEGADVCTRRGSVYRSLDSSDGVG